MPQSPATRPEDLQVTPWYAEESFTDSWTSGPGDQSSYPSLFFSRNDKQLPSRPDLRSIRGSSGESDALVPRTSSSAPRKAYMDLSDAIALLDETCPNPDASPSLTPRTPRTPLNLNSRNKRARSKSSDNSSNYSNERLNDKSVESKDREKRRPFLKKIGISKTEDRPFLSKIAPRITGKPYLEKIGPSKALERPFLDKIGSSKTLDKFNFESLKEIPRAMMRRTQTIVEPTLTEKARTEETINDSILVVEEEEIPEIPDTFNSVERRRSGKGLLLKMYSFETEDLDDISVKNHRDPLRGSSLDDVVDTGPSSLPPLEDVHEPSSPTKLEASFSGGVELVKCRVTTSEEIVSSSTGYAGSPRAAASWSNSPRWSTKRNDKPSMIFKTLERNFSSREISLSDEETVPNSPTKRRISKVSPEPQMPIKVVPAKSKNSSLPRDLDASPTKTRRQASEEPLESQIKNPEFEQLAKVKQMEEKTRSAELLALKSRRQTFNEALEKFGGTGYANRARRQISEDILDKSEDKKGSEYEEYHERRGISSDNLKYSRETVVESAPSASSLGYQSGSDSPFASQRSSNNSQDMLKGTFKGLQGKFEVQDVPAESYAAFKRRTRTEYQTVTERYKFIAKETISPTVQVSKVYEIKTKDPKGQTEVVSNLKSKPIEQVTSKDDRKDTTQTGSTKAVLKKQEGIDHSNEEEITGSFRRRPLRRIFHEPSQETMDLLTELKKIKSLLRTPSEETKDWELDCLKPARLPKKISLSDKEFCLSIERENSIRRPSILKFENESKKEPKTVINQEKKNEEQPIGPALFEKRCLSLDYADDAKPTRPEVRTISLVSARTPRSGTDETIDSFDPGILYDSKSCLSDVFTPPSDETDNNITSPVKQTTKNSANHSSEVDIAIPVDQTGSASPKKRAQIQGRTSDLYEIISPRSTPFRVKKRLGRISVEESVKPESFTIDKVDCRSAVTQKKTKCFPL
ncbi:uncharacterized protein [Chelonus insularis]|uniref:uncharacterized protein n=1 Tax=Chelonus insularis TaxID=460826 RepID=UPI00158CE4C4|nr:uncharacterized protein LOC118066666 [Chelonus insularis]